MSETDVIKENRAEYMRRYRKEHRDQINTYARRRYLKKWETIRAQQKAYYQRKKAKLEEVDNEQREAD